MPLDAMDIHSGKVDPLAIFATGSALPERIIIALCLRFILDRG